MYWGDRAMDEAMLRREMVRLAKSLFDRGYSVGSAGNISAALPDGGFLMTPTNSSLGHLDPDRLSRLDADWGHIDGDKPSKEVFLHRAFYETRPGTGAVVHLHSTFPTAISCLETTDPDDCIPPLTPYVVMRVGTVRMVPYVHPGDTAAGDLIRGLGGDCAAVLLQNHGPVVSAKELLSAVYASEELEETAKLIVLLKQARTRMLSPETVAELKARFG